VAACAAVRNFCSQLLLVKACSRTTESRLSGWLGEVRVSAAHRPYRLEWHARGASGVIELESVEWGTRGRVQQLNSRARAPSGTNAGVSAPRRASAAPSEGAGAQPSASAEEAKSARVLVHGCLSKSPGATHDRARRSPERQALI
jgi:hypothetical protein